MSGVLINKISKLSHAVETVGIIVSNIKLVILKISIMVYVKLVVQTFLEYVNC